ncbi:hypothetical protein RD792_012762 [Penstemon davidsonii]|uniref:Uncharacterized protein n=1 Tax=Penstemon davidsonii TaxID=160366 RepID=A0ABR0CZ97_9LAMI|nr:hypothetical protein RD792_012762 [Penstemon davidsonii]
MGRAPCCDKANVKKGPWSPEEDATLKAYIEKNGTGGNWIALPQKIGLKRCGKSCRLRWLNYLRPNLKHGGFTDEEDNIICTLYISIGSRWSIIAAQLPGRTDNDIKNYWNTSLKKKLLGRRKQSNINRQEPKLDDHDFKDNSFTHLQNLSSSAMERLQLHAQLQSPYSFWPKLSPLQQKMIQTLNSINQNQNILIHDQNTPAASNNGFSHFEINQGYSDLIEKNKGTVQTDFTFSTDQLLEKFEGQIAGEFDCFKEMEGSKGNFAWWDSNEFDTNSGSSTNYMQVHHQSQEYLMYRDYGMGWDRSAYMQQ